MRRPFTLGLYFACVAIEGIICIFLLALIPADPDNALLWGRSMTRLAMIAASFAFCLVFASLAVKAGKDSDWRDRVDEWIAGYIRSDRWLAVIVALLVAGVLTGAYLQLGALTAVEPLHRSYLVRLGPWSLWFAVLSLSGLVFIWVHYRSAWHEYITTHRASLLAMIGILLLAATVHMLLGNMDIGQVKTTSVMDQDELTDPIEQRDIYQVYLRGRDLLHGDNPYDGLTRSELGVQTKPSTYLPMVYYVSWATQRLGFSELSLWLDVQQGIFLFFNLAVAYLLFHVGYFDYDSLLLAILGALFWLFNRWTLFATLTFQFDSIPVFLFVASLVLLPRNRLASYLLLGVSMAFRQMGILFVPVYLIWAWQPRDGAHLGRPAVAALWIGVIPFLASLPFIVVNPAGFFDSIWYSVARTPITHMGALSLDALFGGVGIAAKIPALALMLLVYSIAWRRWLPLYATAMMLLFVFLDFNSVLFNQYMVWIAPLILLTVMETTGYLRMKTTPGVLVPRGGP